MGSESYLAQIPALSLLREPAAGWPPVIQGTCAVWGADIGSDVSWLLCLFCTSMVFSLGKASEVPPQAAEPASIGLFLHSRACPLGEGPAGRTPLSVPLPRVLALFPGSESLLSQAGVPPCSGQLGGVVLYRAHPLLAVLLSPSPPSCCPSDFRTVVETAATVRKSPAGCRAQPVLRAWTLLPLPGTQPCSPPA